MHPAVGHVVEHEIGDVEAIAVRRRRPFNPDFLFRQGLWFLDLGSRQ